VGDNSILVAAAAVEVAKTEINTRKRVSAIDSDQQPLLVSIANYYSLNGGATSTLGSRRLPM
jgi:hypothetical protein